MTDSTGTTQRTYDDENRVLTKTVPGIGTITYQYDILEAAGGYSELSTDPKGNVTEKIFDKASRLEEVTEGNNTTTYQYYSNGSRKRVEYPGGEKEDYTYFRDGLLKTLINTKNNGAMIDSYSYTYDAAHNQTTKTDSKGLTRYEYDSLSRLSKVTEPGDKTTSYLYDRSGNRIQETVLEKSSSTTTTGTTTTSTTTTYSYNEQNRLTETVTRAGFVTEKVKYEYDNNGNTLVKVKETTKPVDPDMAGSFAFQKAGTSTTREVAFREYNVWNQLSKTIEGDKTLTYRYNGEGYRVEKAVNEQITRYLYEADKVILEVDGQGNETARNVYGSNLLMREAGSEKYYYMYNGHGDVTALLGRNGEISATYYYDAFGNITEQTGDADNPIRYAGYQYDEETGIYYLNARYYDPKIARFLTEDTYRGDPNDPLSLNLYTYCHNEPMMYTDPTGHFISPIIGAAIAAGVKAIVNIVSNANKESSKKDKDKDKNKSKDNGSSSSSGKGSSNIQGVNAIVKSVDNIVWRGLANTVNQIAEAIESLKSPWSIKNTHNVTGMGKNASNSFVIEYGPAIAYAGDGYASWMFPQKVDETVPNIMTANTGDASVETIFAKWWDTNPQLRYGNDLGYDIFSVTSFQSKLLHYSKNGKDLSKMSIEELDREFEQELSDHADGIMGMAAAVFAKMVQAVKGAAKAVTTKGTSKIWKNADLLDDLASSGVKYNANDVLAVTKTGNGKLVWLESGNSKAGMQHILDHADDFAKKGIQQNQIKDLVMESLTNGKVVGYQGRGTGRPIYEVTFGGKTYQTAITVGDNGFIVGANPTTWP